VAGTEPGEDAEVWIGLVEVRPLPGCVLLGGAGGAYTHALAWAASEEAWRASVRRALADLKLDVVEEEDVSPLLFRRLDDEVHQDVLAAAQEVRTTGEVRLTSFHVWR
jgi:hypothetical protein